MVRVSFLGTVVLMAGGFRATCDLCFLGNGVWELLAEKNWHLVEGSHCTSVMAPLKTIRRFTDHDVDFNSSSTQGAFPPLAVRDG